MPTLATVEIPVYSTSPSSGRQSSERGNAPVKPLHRPRTYNDEPLPIGLSQDAPADAHILGRVIDVNGALYHLKIGDVEINDVGIDEVLDYVSPQHLEEYENQQFEHQAELLRIAEVEQERREVDRIERRKERARSKGAVLLEERDGGRVTTDSGDAEVAFGKHGRARPTYKHMFLKFGERRRRRRDPATGELLPLSDEEMAGVAAIDSSEDEPPTKAQTQPASSAEAMKKRRRKRNPVTGELMPLERDDESRARSTIGEKKKRRRRRRHPRTGELMPFGWHYDPNAPEERKATTARRTIGGDMSPALKRLSISKEHDAKRVKLDSQSSSSRSRSAQVVLQVPVEESSSEEALGNEILPKTQPSQSQVTPRSQASASRGQLGVPPRLQSGARFSAPQASPGPNTMTSILQPGGTNDEQNDLDDSDDLEEGEWVIEAVLAHHMSDARTHAPELGKKPVMLYQVKWEGYDEPTWEPIESFPDRSVVEEYQQRVEAQSAQDQRKNSITRDQISLAPTSLIDPLAKPSLQPTLQAPAGPGRDAEGNEDMDDEDEEDDSYEVEAIQGHHMSDPRTHGPDFGKDPVMLYKVKWKGYETPTWEPIDSFEDRSVVHQYRRKVGLPAVSDEEDDDDNEDEMEL